jgi:hypothetical protein
VGLAAAQIPAPNSTRPIQDFQDFVRSTVSLAFPDKTESWINRFFHHPSIGLSHLFPPTLSPLGVKEKSCKSYNPVNPDSDKRRIRDKAFLRSSARRKSTKPLAAERSDIEASPHPIPLNPSSPDMFFFKKD